jgi:sterol desaturase/sphingolipid hydroxylase (fatty acid hydroxylase superfamily)
LLLVGALRYPELLTVPQIRQLYDTTLFRVSLHLLLVTSFFFSILNLGLRRNKTLGTVAIIGTLLAVSLGGSNVAPHGELVSGVFLGVDWFVLNVLCTALLFIPLERIFARLPNQPTFRHEWREDLFYFFVSSIFIQSLSFISLKPALLLATTSGTEFLRMYIEQQPFWLQLIEIMVCTDLAQYWVHRAFHRIPWLWKFHSVHHSATTMDWMAGARMHILEIIVLRGLTVIPMFGLGFSELAMQVYVLIVYLYSTFIHANLGWQSNKIGAIVVTPRFHHWHHGVDREAIDVNFAIHFSFLYRLFGTYYFPKDKWPSGYGIKRNPVPKGYIRQFLYPFK